MKVNIAEFPDKALAFRCQWRERVFDKDLKLVPRTRSRFFPSRAAARAFKRQKENEAHNDPLACLNDLQRLEVWEAFRLCQERKVPLLKIVRQHIGSPARRPAPTLDFAIDLYLRHCQDRHLRPATIAGYRQMLLTFNRAVNNIPIASITPDLVKEFVLASYQNEKSRRDAKGALSPFFSWADSRGYGGPGQLKIKWDRMIITPRRPGILTVEQASAYIHATRPDLKAAVALQLFTGIRTGELLRFRVNFVENGHSYGIDYKGRSIRLHPDWTKTRRERFLSGLPDNLWQWLDRYGPASGPVVPINYRNLRAACAQARKTAGIKLFPHNACRHSFASYHYWRGLELSLEILGHIGSIRTFNNHYKNAVTQEAAAAFFDIRP